MTRFSKRQRNLLLSAAFLSVFAMFAVPFLTGTLTPLVGFVSVFVIYWVCFCIPVAIFFGKGETPVRLDLRAASLWIPAIAAMLPVGVFFGADTMSWVGTDPAMAALAVGVALFNGPLEELAWRRTFRANSGGRISFELIGLFLFTLWHVPLYFAEGISFDQGALGLVGGSMMLGAVWMVITRRSNSVGWPMVSHALVNMAAFIPLFAGNFSA
ncbi:CPBP family intramembrane metalloprotease [Pacificimonas sp. WHA3]|uniref:CPBP family intramembrane metalloprotease n=1 Tax=Pacificimonas pallii TaxID=2827236 RepID=A0ABS6SFK5_9SPHN|nr:CPBP family intramembrane glutamic endopeptidase [Pacificimonas pallii]MBV7257121.1 CPBP family intramembrane metalloprotease [Pacificimonas pallii]